MKLFDHCLFYLLISHLEREGEREAVFCSVGIWTQAKVPTTSGVINCMAKKKGHLSATPYLDQHYKRGDIHMCADTHAHLHSHKSCTQSSHHTAQRWIDWR